LADGPIEVVNRFDDATAVPGNPGVRNLSLQAFEACRCARLFRPHQAGITDHVSAKYRGKPAFHLQSPLRQQIFELLDEDLFDLCPALVSEGQ